MLFRSLPFSFLLSPRAPRPRRWARASSPALGVEGTPKSAPRRSLMPLLASPPPFSFLFSPLPPSPSTSSLGPRRLPGLGRGGYPEICTEAKPNASSCLPPPFPFSVLLSPEPLALVAAPAQAPWPWAWRVPPKSAPRRSLVPLLASPPPFPFSFLLPPPSPSPLSLRPRRLPGLGRGGYPEIQIGRAHV